MSWGWTLLGTFGELMLAYVLFMLVAFAGGGIANGEALSPGKLKMLDLSMFALPGACVLSALLVLCLHGCGGSVRSYAWYALPLAVTAAYLGYLGLLARQARRDR